MTERTPPSPTAQPQIPVRAAPPAPPARTGRPAPVTGPWRLPMLMAAPHRLGFFLAMVVLVAASGWWWLVQEDRVHGWFGLGYAVSPTLTHATAMVFGFMPLFFSGFLFTAGPNWLRVPPLAATQLLAPLLLQAGGWLLWLAGAHLNAVAALAGLALAAVGLAWMVALFWRLISASQVPDRVHAKAVGIGGIVGVLCLAGAGGAMGLGQDALALVLVRTALWGFIVVTYVSVAHRMIPFFTSNVLPMIDIWRPFWVLWLMLGVAVFEVLALWVDYAAPSADAWPAWTVLVIAVELAAGGVLLWLAVVWGLVQSLKIRLLAMLHVGFVWLGLALLYSAVSQGLWLATGQAVLGLGALHALGMGFLGSIMIAMVTRVSCGHSGRALVADNPVWVMFWLLQVAVGVRLVAAVQGMPQWVTALAAMLWTVIITVWAARYANWYGRPRVDGKAG
ncbi:MAG: NnrS family protein [Pseudomonadota bacterium]|nr:NnrS family protein [Pseudomonadota bacterium]